MYVKPNKLYHGTMETAITTNITHANTISSKVEQKMMVVCKFSYTWKHLKNQQPPMVTIMASGKTLCSLKKYSMYHHQQASFGTLRSFEPCPIVLFGILLFRLDTNSSHAYSRQ